MIISDSPSPPAPLFVSRRKAHVSLSELPSLPVGGSLLIPARDRFNAYKRAQSLGIRIAVRTETDVYDRIWRIA